MQMQQQQMMMETAQNVAPKVADNVTKPRG